MFKGSKELAKNSMSQNYYINILLFATYITRRFLFCPLRNIILKNWNRIEYFDSE